MLRWFPGFNEARFLLLLYLVLPMTRYLLRCFHPCRHHIITIIILTITTITNAIPMVKRLLPLFCPFHDKVILPSPSSILNLFLNIVLIVILINIFFVRGSFLIYRGWLQPLLCKHETTIDGAIENLWQEITWSSTSTSLSSSASSSSKSSSKVDKEAGWCYGKQSCAGRRRDC